jgi:hypothetical protein
MDPDTIFPALSLGEEVLNKYQDSGFCGRLKLIILLTNFRLLIRWEFISCGSFSPSYYSSINLRSIHRIDNTPSSSNVLMMLPLIVIFSGGFSMFFIGIMLSIKINSALFITFGILLMIASSVAFVLLFIVHKRKCIQLKGTFGTAILKFPEDIARELVGRLSEMIYHRKMKRTLQQIKHQQQPSAPIPYYENQK